jgi:hypothetical protein
VLWFHSALFFAGTILMAFLVISGVTPKAHAHGGKSHTDGGVTAFEALQEA